MTHPITTDAQQIIAAELELALGLPWQEAEPVAERIATRLASTSPAPDGWVLVPRELTDEMMQAWFETPRTAPFRTSQQYFGDCYRAMIAAAPQPVVVESGQ